MKGLRPTTAAEKNFISCVPTDLIYEGITTSYGIGLTKGPAGVPTDLIYEGITTYTAIH